jgi:hypothetical protein
VFYRFYFWVVRLLRTVGSRAPSKNNASPQFYRDTGVGARCAKLKQMFSERLSPHAQPACVNLFFVNAEIKSAGVNCHSIADTIFLVREIARTHFSALF